MMAVEGSDIQEFRRIPGWRWWLSCEQSVEVGDHILHTCQVEKPLGDEDKKGLYAWERLRERHLRQKAKS